MVANAPWRWTSRFAALVRGADRVLAADGGANHLARLGVRPEAVVGDLDSILPHVRAWVGEDRLVPRPDQNFTDLEKTLLYAVDELGVRTLTVLAATGGRLDHALANLGLVGRLAGRAEVEVVDELTRIVAVRGTASFATTPGQTVSLVPLGHCPAVTTSGLRWSLQAEPLDLLGRTGVSNVALGTRVELTVDGGTLLVFFHHLGEFATTW